VPVRHDREFWERACREVHQGAKVSDIARRLGVSPRTLQWWSWKLRQEPAGTTAFLPVVATEHPVVTSTMPLELEANGVRIRVEIGADVRYVAALVAALRGTC
jgi:transposase-like protein